MNYNKKTLEDVKIDEKQFVRLLELIDKKEITDNVAQKILEKLIEESFDIEDYIEENKLKVVANAGEIEKFCKEAIAESEKAVSDYKKGNEKALNFVVGLVMKKTRGAAKPDVVLEIIKKLI